MDIDTLKLIMGDLRHFTLFPRRRKPARGKDVGYWRAEMRRYGNAEKRILSSDYHWYILEFADGKKELAYLRVLQDGFLSGKSPAIYRGIVIPFLLDYATFSNITHIRLAF